MATTTAPAPELPEMPPPVLGFLLVHAALRHDAGELVRAARRGRPLDARLELFDRVLRAHHHGEDEVLLPLLGSREPAIAEVSERIADQHAALDDALDRLRAGVGARPVVDDVASLRDRLEDHLQLEEQELLPRWTAALDPAEHRRFARRLRRATPWRDIAVMVPWLIEAVPEELRPAAEAELPRPVLLAYRFALRSHFRRRWCAPDEVGTLVLSV